MSITQPSRNSRRHRALVTHLLSLPSMAYEKIDWLHPLMASATHAEYREALEEAEALSTDSLAEVFRKRIGDNESYSWLIPSENWTDFRTARFENPRRVEILAGRSFLVYTDLDIFQVNTAGELRGSNGRGFYIKSLIDDNFFGWFHAQQTGSGRFHMSRLIGLPVSGYPDQFALNAMISPRKLAEMIAHHNTSPLAAGDPMITIARLFT